MNYYCQTCLSIGRKLNPPCYNFTEIDAINSVCWECNSVIKKFALFIAQVQKVQNSLHNVEYDLKPLSNLLLSKTEILEVTIQEQQQKSISGSTIIICRSRDSLQDCTDDNDFLDADNETSLNGANSSLAIKDETSNPKCEFPIDKVMKKENALYSDNASRKHVFKCESKEVPATYQEEVKRNETEKMRGKDKRFDECESVSDLSYEHNEMFEKVILSKEEIAERRKSKRGHFNYRKTLYKCDKCILGFSKENMYRVHVKKLHDKKAGNYVCGVCQCRFRMSSTLLCHLNSHFVRYKCRLCSYAAKAMGAMITHCRDKHPGDNLGRIQCQNCDYVVDNLQDMKKHTDEKHKHLCDICKAEFAQISALKKHIARRHLNEVGLQCKFCDKMYISKARLETHMVKHDPSLTYCTVCKIQYKNMLTFRQHLKNNINHRIENVYQCAHCNKKSASKHYLRQHIKFKHLKMSDHKCQTCDKIFMTVTALKEHRQTHHGLERPRKHHCHQCGKSFYTPKALKVHQSVHSQLREYMCEECGDTFKQRSTLYTHSQLVHKDKLKMKKKQ